MLYEISNNLKRKSSMLILLGLNLQWYNHIMRNVILRYKILFIFIVAVLVPSFAVLQTILIEPLKIIFYSPVVRPINLILTLAVYQFVALIWLSLNDIVLFKQPWRSYLSSLGIDHHQNLVLNICMLLFVDAIILIPLMLSALFVVIEGDFAAGMFFLVMVKTVSLIAVTVFAQLLWQRGNALLLLLILNVSIVVSIIYLPPVLQIIVLIGMVPLGYQLIPGGGSAQTEKSIGEAKEIHGQHDGPFYKKTFVISRLLIKEAICQVSQYAMIFLMLCVILSIVVVLLFSSGANTHLLQLISVMMLLNSVCVANVFHRLDTAWRQNNQYLISLPVNMLALYASYFMVCLPLLMIFNLAIFILSIKFHSVLMLIELTPAMLLSILLLSISFYPQIKLPRYGSLITFVFMILFVLIDFKCIS